MSEIYTVALWVYLLAGAFTLVQIFSRMDRTSKRTKREVWSQYVIEAVALILGLACLLAAPWSLVGRLSVALALLVVSMAANMLISAPRWKDGAPKGTTAAAPLDEEPISRMEARP